MENPQTVVVIEVWRAKYKAIAVIILSAAQVTLFND